VQKGFISKNYPNPFNPLTQIEFQLKRDALVSIDIYNSLGQKVENLVANQFLHPGKHSFQWDAANYSTGQYFYRLKIDRESYVNKMTLIK